MRRLWGKDDRQGDVGSLMIDDKRLRSMEAECDFHTLIYKIQRKYVNTYSQICEYRTFISSGSGSGCSSWQTKHFFPK